MAAKIKLFYIYIELFAKNGLSYHVEKQYFERENQKYLRKHSSYDTTQ